MELEPKKMQQLAKDIWMLRANLRFLGYYMTRDADRQKGEYTIDDLVSQHDWDALRSNTDEMIDGSTSNVANALGTIKDVRELCSKVLINMDWFEAQLQKNQ